MGSRGNPSFVKEGAGLTARALYVVEKIDRQLVGWTSNNILTINSYVLNQSDTGKLIHDQPRIGWARIAIGAHQIQMIVLKANRLHGIFSNPAREESDTMTLHLIEVVGDRKSTR